jgi:hypothetical protein
LLGILYISGNIIKKENILNNNYMGFNISGLVINKNYQENFEELQIKLGWNLKKVEEIDFETASSNWKDEEFCDVYFSENGTLLFLNIDYCTSSYEFIDLNTLTFAISEVSMAFNLNYCENAVEKRAIMEVNGDMICDEGEMLKVEEISKETSEIIWNQMEVVLGKKFWDIQPDEKAIRYSFYKQKEMINVEEIVDKNNDLKQSENNEFLENKIKRNIENSTKKENVKDNESGFLLLLFAILFILLLLGGLVYVIYGISTLS